MNSSASLPSNLAELLARVIAWLYEALAAWKAEQAAAGAVAPAGVPAAADGSDCAASIGLAARVRAPAADRVRRAGRGGSACAVAASADTEGAACAGRRDAAGEAVGAAGLPRRRRAAAMARSWRGAAGRVETKGRFVSEIGFRSARLFARYSLRMFIVPDLCRAPRSDRRSGAAAAAGLTPWARWRPDRFFSEWRQAMTVTLPGIAPTAAPVCAAHRRGAEAA
jgi:hypothetical protein